MIRRDSKEKLLRNESMSAWQWILYKEITSLKVKKKAQHDLAANVQCWLSLPNKNIRIAVGWGFCAHSQGCVPMISALT